MTTYKTRYGPIFYDNSGNDHRPNIVDSHPRYSRRHEAVKLQRAALRAFRESEKMLGRRLHPGKPWKLLKAVAIPVTGSWRSFDLQASLYRSDPKRYASPYTSGHVQGIAIDVNTLSPHFMLILQILDALGWKQARADEPWHHTWGVEV